jgi:sirohydrochlorin cobaltochelatase
MLVGHGTRHPQGTAEFFSLVESVAIKLGPLPVAACFLELTPPAISDAWCDLVKQGATRIRIMPVLLWAAGHALRDIPQALAKHGAEAPHISYDQTEPLRFHPLVIQRSRELVERVLVDHPHIQLRRAALVLVGRGSMESSATVDMLHFGDLRSHQHPFARVEVGFFAMALPTLGSILDELVEDPAIDQIVIQPHLLFAGELECSICKMVQRAAARSPQKRWYVTGLLGPDEKIADAVVDRIFGSTS